MTVPSAPVRIPSLYPLARVLRQSRLSANDKGDNEKILGDEMMSVD